MTQKRQQQRRQRQRGFTLLEMMIATGILGMSLMWLVEASTRAMTASNHAKLMGTATFLARGRLVELEDELAEKGFTDDSFAKETTGDFDDKGFKRFQWSTIIDKVELPGTDQVQNMVTKAMEGQQTPGSGGGLGDITSQIPGAAMMQSQSGAGGTGGPMSAGAGMLSSQFGLIKEVLEQGIRRARVKVTWVETTGPQSVEIFEYLTDPRRVDMTVQMPTLPAGATPANPTGTPAAGGANTPASNATTTPAVPR